MHPDFVTLSFYKMFGFPTGVGALLVRNAAAGLLEKVYWGGGTVSMASELFRFNKFHVGLRARCDVEPAGEQVRGRDAELPGDRLRGHRPGGAGKHRHAGHSATRRRGLRAALRRTRQSATRVAAGRRSLCSNGLPLVEIYGKHALRDPAVQGGVLSMNLRRADGSYIGYYTVQIESARSNIHLRTGCHCNPGACRKYLRQPEFVYQEVWSQKDSCSDSIDSYRGVPLGGGADRSEG